MAESPQSQVTPEQVKLIAAMSGVSVDQKWLASVARRLAEMRAGSAILAALPLKDIEPAAVFRVHTDT